MNNSSDTIGNQSRFLPACSALSQPNKLHDKKGKAVPLQAWSDPEDSSKLRLPNFMTTAQGGGKVVSLMHLPPLSPGNAPGTHFR